MTGEQVRELLTDAWWGQKAQAWGFDRADSERKDSASPLVGNVPPAIGLRGAQLVTALFERAPIEWNVLSAFQDVTMRLIGERLLAADHPRVYLPGEIAEQRVTLRVLGEGRRFDLFCSEHNEGAWNVAQELNDHLKESHTGGALRRCPGGLGCWRERWRAAGKDPLQLSRRREELEECEQMLVYLHAATWTGAASAAFADEVREAQRLGVRLLLVHELPSAIDDGLGSRRHDVACPFEDFFVSTPRDLREADGNIYEQIATALKTGAWRKASLSLFAAKVAEGGGDRTRWRVASRLEPRAPPRRSVVSSIVSRFSAAAVGGGSNVAGRWYEFPHAVGAVTCGRRCGRRGGADGPPG